MAKSDRFYFDNFSAVAAIIKEMAEYLLECMNNFERDKASEMLEKMHALEHRADKKHHEMNSALIKAFVTPLERGDLDLLSAELDEVADKIEEVLQACFVSNIGDVRPDCIEFSRKLLFGCELIEKMMAELSSFKKSKKLAELTIKVNSVEEECDRLYLGAMRLLNSSEKDALYVLSWQKIYECFENCADSCEHISNCVNSVVLKNM